MTQTPGPPSGQPSGGNVPPSGPASGGGVPAPGQRPGQAPAQGPAQSPGRSAPPSGSASSSSTSPSAPSGKLGERIGTAISTAKDEHRANRAPESKRAAERAAQSTGRRPRRARLRLSRIDPWSVMKAAFLLSVAFGVVTIVAVTIVWSVLGTAGVWDSVNQMVHDVIGGEETSDFDVENYLGMSRVLGFTMLVAVVDVVLLTAMATLGAFLYNMAAALLGGVELTLAEDED